jgi:hypothetical protein
MSLKIGGSVRPAGNRRSRLFGPGEPHQIINDSEKDLVFYIIADNPLGESCYYPDDLHFHL